MSTSSLSRTVGRTGLAASAAALLAFGLAAAPAAAEPETYEGSARAQYTDNAENGVRVNMGGANVPTSLFNLKLEDGGVLTTYCIDFRTNIIGDAWYREDEWANYPGKGDFAEPAKVHWILQNGYPAVDTETLASEAGIQRLSKDEALAATQAAIWHFSNDMSLDKRNKPNVKALFEYLTSNAQDLAQTAEPDAALSITPGEASGKAGEVVGEFTVETNATEIPVSLEAPEGVELVDVETGEAATTVDNGDVVGFSVPEDAEAGQASFSLEASATVETGRLFKGEEKYQPTQTLITAEGGEVTVSASASASWAEGGETPPEEPEEPETPEEPEEPTEPAEPEEPTEPAKPEEPSDKPSAPSDDKNEPTLPVTGGALAGLVAAGVAALGAGGGAIYFSRKRKAANAEDLEG